MNEIDRATRTGGTSSDAIYQLVADSLRRRKVAGRLYDIGCGTGALARYLTPGQFDYLGVDLVHYDRYPASLPFLQLSLDQPNWNLEPESADVVVSVETIEHIENPRHHVRQMTRLARPGGIVLVTTPNNLSWLSLVTLLRKGVFNAFQEGQGLYPSHITALVETDLRRMFAEAGLVEVEIGFTNSGRVPFTSRRWPHIFRGRRYSDNILACGRKPA
jgi:2-polyprenyl-3-methyl-5-hydroxy-6-metoxy-1,4-benzoquinol methylase